MGTSTQTARAKLIPAKVHKVYNLTVATANVEFSQALTNGTRKLMIRTRGTGRIRFTFVSGESGTNFLTIPGAAVYSVDNIELQNKTLYMQCDQVGEVVEIEEWS
jgi:hypothetical protein